MAGSGYAYEIEDGLLREFATRNLVEEIQIDPELTAEFDAIQAQWEAANRTGDAALAQSLLQQLSQVGYNFPRDDWHNPNWALYNR